MDPRAVIGARGEEAAVRLYRGLGYAILDRNYRAGRGEIDIVAAKGSEIVFCEVKTRTSDLFGSPEEAVTARKQARLRALATRWLTDRKPDRSSIRFDVASVSFRDGRIEVRLISDAF